MSRTVGVRPSSSPSSRSCCDQLVAADEPPRPQPGRALGGVPRPEVLDHGLRDARPPRGRPRTHAWSASVPGARRRRAARRGSPRPCIAGAGPPRNSARARLVDPREGRMPPAGACHAIMVDHFRQLARGPERRRPPLGSLDAVGARLALETSAARLVGRLSRAAGRGGGTTLPGKLVWKLDPGALDALAARLPLGVALVSATNGKTTTTAMASAHPLAHPPPCLEPLRRQPRLGGRVDPARGA